MPLRPLDRAMAVRFAALAVLCPERTLTEVADARNLPQQLATLFDEAVVIGPGHVRLHLPPEYKKQISWRNHGISQPRKIRTCTLSWETYS